MNAVVIEHVALAELPNAWRERLVMPGNARVRVVVEEEAGDRDTAFGMWRDCGEMTDVDAYVRRLLPPRFGDAVSMTAGNIHDVLAFLGRTRLFAAEKLTAQEIETQVAAERLAWN